MANNIRRDVPVYDGRDFTWHGRSGCIDVTDLPPTSFNRPFFVQLFDDACDEGFQVRSHRTGKVETFYHTGNEADRDGDLRCWVFESAGGVVVKVFND